MHQFYRDGGGIQRCRIRAEGIAGKRPNILFILDDSGSMADDFMPDNVPGTSTVNVAAAASVTVQRIVAVADPPADSPVAVNVVVADVDETALTPEPDATVHA